MIPQLATTVHVESGFLEKGKWRLTEKMWSVLSVV